MFVAHNIHARSTCLTFHYEIISIGWVRASGASFLTLRGQFVLMKVLLNIRNNRLLNCGTKMCVLNTVPRVIAIFKSNVKLCFETNVQNMNNMIFGSKFEHTRRFVIASHYEFSIPHCYNTRVI